MKPILVKPMSLTFVIVIVVSLGVNSFLTIAPHSEYIPLNIENELLKNLTASNASTSITMNLTYQLQSYYNPIMKGFRAYPFGTTDYYDYWADDTGKILTAASIIHNCTIANEAFEFLHRIRAYEYEMPARIVETRLHLIQNGIYGNEIIFAGGSPFSFGVDLFGANTVAYIYSINEYSTFSIISRNNSIVFNFGTANVTLSTVNYLLITTSLVRENTIQFYLPRIYPVIVKAFYSNLTEAGEVLNLGRINKEINGIIVYDPEEGVINNIGGFALIGNISQASLKYPYFEVSFTGSLKLYIFDITFDPAEADYVMYGLLKGLYLNNSDISTPASFGYILLGSALYGLETGNNTVIKFAKGFLNFWLPIVKKEIANRNFYPRSLSTFFLGAILLEPNNASILNLAIEYLNLKPGVVTESAPYNEIAGIGPTAALIHILNKFYDENISIEPYISYQYTVDNTLPSSMTIPYKVGEDLLGWLWAGESYNSSITITLVNQIFNVITADTFTPPYYIFTNYANTEGVPAILESLTLWQWRMYNATEFMIDRWTYFNVSNLISLKNNTVLNISGKPMALILHIEVYIPDSDIENISVLVNGNRLMKYSNLSEFVSTQYYSVHYPTLPSGWYYIKNEKLLLIQYFPTNTLQPITFSIIVTHPKPSVTLPATQVSTKTLVTTSTSVSTKFYILGIAIIIAISVIGIVVYFLLKRK